MTVVQAKILNGCLLVLMTMMVTLAGLVIGKGLVREITTLPVELHLTPSYDPTDDRFVVLEFEDTEQMALWLNSLPAFDGG